MRECAGCGRPFEEVNFEVDCKECMGKLAEEILGKIKEIE